PGMIVHHLTARATRGRLRADALNIERQQYLAGLLEFQRDRHLVTLLERALEVHDHQVIAAGRELYGLAGLDGEALVERPHRHHAVIHRHLVHLDPASDVAAATDQPVRRRALVLDGYI